MNKDIGYLKHEYEKMINVTEKEKEALSPQNKEKKAFLEGEILGLKLAVARIDLLAGQGHEL